MAAPHKHHDLIVAWAKGAEIQVSTGTGWLDCREPWWLLSMKYRIKPEKKPDVVQYLGVEQSMNTTHQSLWKQEDSNIKITFDGETGELKSVEKI